MWMSAPAATFHIRASITPKLVRPHATLVSFTLIIPTQTYLKSHHYHYLVTILKNTPSTHRRGIAPRRCTTALFTNRWSPPLATSCSKQRSVKGTGEIQTVALAGLAYPPAGMTADT